MTTLSRSKLIASSKRQKGFTLIELAIVLVVIGLLVAVSLPVINSSRDTAKVDAGMSMVRSVLMGAQKFGPRNGDKTGISMQALADRGLIPEEWGAGAAAGNNINPWGGSVTITVNGGDPRLVDIAFTNIDDPEAGLLFSDYAREDGADAAAFAGGTMTMTIKAG